MRVAISGASGLIGSALSRSLQASGHDVLTLVRRTANSPLEIAWDPERGELDPAALVGIDAIVHLAGAGVGDKRWTATYKRTILESRVNGTRTIARALASRPDTPRVFVCGSAIGFYGETGDRPVDETAPAGDGFLADVVVQWERAAQPAVDAGVRVAFARTGLVAAPGAGAFGKLLPIFKLGAGGKLGSGRQYWSLISLRDQVRALEFLLDHTVTGPVNLTAPEPQTNAAVTKALASALRRPAVIPVPGFALRLVVGEFAGDILGSQRVVPRRLLDAGFNFRDGAMEQIVAELVRR
jgi:uncharacterized protein (TIGR01777 family)